MTKWGANQSGRAELARINKQRKLEEQSPSLWRTGKMCDPNGYASQEDHRDGRDQETKTETAP
eukprot:CAMPEP_0206425782 /NCGR_PEP_ID=MMETSP0324_2-20121206/3988_1 /ASSEMBLY_ACC=CAM_ASM_000836 /TAXON_ID=2866 /ORGANISM="Crypthecodinium cohnii, Strain Seligo" /LENGTH=62 /DNA_ID=CAMNT_0053890613 /DNA_START=217 /DNA_END=401 /DNA_ORIENTATION=+